MLKSYYKAEGNTMVSTFVTDGDYHDLMAGANATLGLFGQSLQLSGGVSYCRQWVTGVNSACHDFVRSSLSASYSLGQFAFFAQFQPRVTELYDSNFSETTEQLVFLASWRHKGLYMELGCRNPFERDYVSREWFDFGVYRYDRSDVSRANGRMAWLQLSYSFDFGRKKVERTELEVDRGSSGIMKM